MRAKSVKKHLNSILITLISISLLIIMFAPTLSSMDYYPVIDTPVTGVHENLIDYDSINTSNAFCILPDGRLLDSMPNSTYSIGVSDDGLSFTWLHEFTNWIHSVYYHNGCIFVSTNDSIIWRSTDMGATWSNVLTMKSGGYARHWSWAADNTQIMVGEYGDKTTYARVFVSYSNGETWFTAFNTTLYHAAPAHIHAVSFDPYDPDRFIIGVGDVSGIRGTYVSDNGGTTWEKKFSDYYPDQAVGDIICGNGPLVVLYPNDKQAWLLGDNKPMIYQYTYSTGDLSSISYFPTPYKTYDVKFYGGCVGSNGVSYAAATEYIAGVHLCYIWMTVDGTSWYRMDGPELDTADGNYPLFAGSDGYIYGAGIKFRDLTIPEAFLLIDKDYTSTEMIGGNPQYIDLGEEPLNDVKVTVKGTAISNVLVNPSFEAGNTSWTRDGDGQYKASTNYSRDGSYSAQIAPASSTYAIRLGQVVDLDVKAGQTVVIKLSVRSDVPSVKDPKIMLQYNGAAQKFWIFGGVDSYSGTINTSMHKSWVDLTYTWTPSVDVNINLFKVYLYSTAGWTGNYYMDRASLSLTNVWDYTGMDNDVKFMLGDTMIDAGVLGEYDTYTTTIDELSGSIPVTPISGSHYYIELDGTSVLKAEKASVKMYGSSYTIEASVPGAVITAYEPISIDLANGIEYNLVKGTSTLGNINITTNAEMTITVSNCTTDSIHFNATGPNELEAQFAIKMHEHYTYSVLIGDDDRRYNSGSDGLLSFDVEEWPVEVTVSLVSTGMFDILSGFEMFIPIVVLIVLIGAVIGSVSKFKI